jgi:hypothetical protein
MTSEQTQPTVPVWIQVAAWEDIFVVIDDGRGQASDYQILRGMVADQSSRYERGLGCLAVIPSNAKPPSEEVRASINETLESVRLRCICWCVEGSGFQAAMVRGVLSGLRFFKRRQYPTHISSDLETALAWMLPYLESGPAGADRAPLAAASIREQRARPIFGDRSG